MRTLEITTKIGCSNMCRYCPQKIFVNRYRRLSHQYIFDMDKFKVCLDKVPKDVKIVFSGMVEPWLNRQMTEMLLYIYEQGYRGIEVYTTGVGLDMSDINRIKDIPYTMFMVHLADAKNNAKIPVTEKYLTLMKKIKRSSIKNINYMTMDKLHPKLIPLFGKLAEAKPMLSRVGLLDGFNPINHKGPITCNSPSGLKHNVLMPNGDIFLCCMDFGLKHRLGNLLENSYEDLFRGKEFISIQKKLKNDQSGEVICRHCEYAIVDNYKKYFRPIKQLATKLLKLNSKL